MMQFIGTSAGEGIPNPFCSCEVCENARRVGGKEIRTRSCFRLSESFIIDPGADYLTQCAFYGVDFVNLRHVIYTHTHDDHFNYTLFWERAVRANRNNEPIHVYFVGEAYDILDKFYMTNVMTAGRENYTKPSDIEFHRLEFFTEYEIDGHKIVAFPGRHSTGVEKNSANFLITTPEGKKLYYALDSGWFLDETYAALEGARLDYFIGECTQTYLDRPAAKKTDGHMNLALFLENCAKLYELGAITSETKVYATHISPYGTTHAKLSEYFASLELPYTLTAAYDTLKID